jgi:putative transposase
MPRYVAVGVTCAGERDILGLWAGDGGEGAKFWLAVLTEIKNRGTGDVCIVVCDGLKGLPEAVNTVWDRAIIQTCVIHLLRNTFRYASRKYWDQIAKDIRPVYTAPTEAAAKERFVEFTTKWGAQYPAITRLWENAWSEFVPFLDYDVEIRRVICSTNAVVIWSPRGVVFDVRHEASGSLVLLSGRGYLQPSRKQSLRRKSACYTGGFTGLVA